ncbi:MAG: G1 family endopeptidase [Chloroflexi bacterium]|nr:G1 family endopeptidase [Chloroflexota bacterium]
MSRRTLLLSITLLVGLLVITSGLVLIVPIAAQAAGPAARAVAAVSAQLPVAAPTLSPTPDAPSAVVTAVQAVILKANHEEEQAVAKNDPTVMQDTATSSYYTQSAQNLSNMLSSGVTAIKLDHLAWGAIAQQNPTTVQATTQETWSTTFSDGSTLQETNTNVYTLVLQNGTWLVQQDNQPNSTAPQSPSNSSPSTPGVPGTPATPAASGQSPSRNWAGYAATSGTFTAVSGSWTVPNVSSTTTGMDATWVGIGGVNSQDLIQAGTQAVVQSGQITYSAWYETLPQSSQTVPMTVNPGDKVSVSITQQPDGTWKILMQDTTNAQTYQTTLNYTSSNSSAEWIEESPATGRGTILPLDSFGTLTFNGASTVDNGKQVTLAQAGAQPITMYSSNQQALAQPSTVGANGASFSVTRTDVVAPTFSRGGRGFSGSGNAP